MIKRHAALGILSILFVLSGPHSLWADDHAYVETDLVSDIPGRAASVDANLVNPWGIVASSTSPFWVSDNGSGLSTLYNGAGTKLGLVVAIPPPAGAAGPAAPTGIVFNSTASDFMVSQGGHSGKASFIFATEDGTISGWSPSVNLANAILEVDNSANPTAADGAVYKGLELATTDDGNNFLYATNFRAATIDVFNQNFAPVHMPGSFTDPDTPVGYAPFGIRNINGKLYVTYALQNGAKHDDVAGSGHGFVDVFDADGHLMRRLISRGKLNSPWGMVIAPDNFGKFSDRLLVGNFGDGRIHAYDLETGEFRGTLRAADGKPIVIPGLWGLQFGNGANAGPTTTLFFTAGIDDEQHGLFGSLTPSAR